jgi:hypothetical protein
VFLTERRFEFPEFLELRAQPGHQTVGKAKLVPEVLHALPPVVEIWAHDTIVRTPVARFQSEATVVERLSVGRPRDTDVTSSVSTWASISE